MALANLQRFSSEFLLRCGAAEMARADRFMVRLLRWGDEGMKDAKLVLQC
jgi:hypothetical protein